MNIIEFAMNMEKEGEAYYRDLAKNCGDSGLARILSQLAESEIQHYEALKRLRDKIDPKIAECDLIADAKGVFADMATRIGEYDFDASVVELYRKAQKQEYESADFYHQKAQEAGQGAQSELFERLAAEEKAHAIILQNIIDFISAPDTWLEDAEWHNTSAY